MTTRFAPGAAAALVAVAVAAGTWAAPAGAPQAHVGTTCARQTKVFNTPGGLVVGFLARGAPVIVRTRTRNHRWAEVRAVHSIVGWVHTGDLC
jgi:hypothetical protein